MDWLFVFAVFLYFACAALIIADVFVPSGGLLILCGLGCAAGGIAIFFSRSPAAGWIGVIVAIIMIPAILVWAYKVFPKTRFGKSSTLEPPKRDLGDAIPDTDQLKGLMGAVGTVVTTLRPVGMADFSGRRVECVAESGFVEKGQKVKVIRIESTQLTVRVINEG